MLRLTLYRMAREKKVPALILTFLWIWTLGTLGLNETLEQPRSHASLLLGPRDRGSRVGEEPGNKDDIRDPKIDLTILPQTANGGLRLAVSR